MEILKANKDDALKILDLYIEGYNYHVKGRPDIFIPRNRDYFLDELNNALLNEEVNIYYLVLDEMVLGYINFIIKNKNKNKRTLWINELVITESKRSCGLGKMLIDKAFIEAKNNNCQNVELNCWLFNENALKIYEHLGFKTQRIVLEKEV